MKMFRGLVLALICGMLPTVLSGTVLWGKEPGLVTTPETASVQSPVQVLKACLQALANEDAQAYVAMLAEEEQRYQAGLFLSVLCNPEEDSLAQSEPATYLLMQSLREIAERHQNPSLREQGLDLTEQVGQVLKDGLYDVAISTSITSQKDLAKYVKTARQTFHQLSRFLEQPDQFLKEAVEQVMIPTQTNVTGPQIDSLRIHLQNTVDLYLKAEWKYYTRGSRALAVLELKSTTPRAAFDLAVEQPATASEDIVAQNPPESTIVTFAQVDGVWRISGLRIFW